MEMLSNRSVCDCSASKAEAGATTFMTEEDLVGVTALSQAKNMS